jgi:hypothetical protein
VSYRNELDNDSNGNLPGQMQPHPQRGARQSMPDVKKINFKSGKSGNRLESQAEDGNADPVSRAKSFLARATAHHRQVTGRGRR